VNKRYAVSANKKIYQLMSDLKIQDSVDWVCRLVPPQALVAPQRDNFVLLFTTKTYRGLVPRGDRQFDLRRDLRP
jgi:hypothetical protein